MRTAVYVVGLFVGLLNVVLFAVWLSLIRVEAGKPQSARGYTIETLALQITVLEIVITLVGFVLAAVGLFGYAEIKAAAISRAKDAAEKEARRVASEQMNIFLQQMSQAGVVPAMSALSSHEVRRPDAGRITEARGE